MTSKENTKPVTSPSMPESLVLVDDGRVVALPMFAIAAGSVGSQERAASKKSVGLNEYRMSASLSSRSGRFHRVDPSNTGRGSKMLQIQTEAEAVSIARRMNRTGAKTRVIAVRASS